MADATTFHLCTLYYMPSDIAGQLDDIAYLCSLGHITHVIRSFSSV
jgi:hypothetical protein